MAESTGQHFAGYRRWGDAFVGHTDSLFVADMNGDRAHDVIGFEKASGTWTVRLSDGRGFGPARTWITGHGVGASHALVGDVDSDGFADLLVRFEHWDGGAVYLALTDPGTLSATGFSCWLDHFGAGAAQILLGDIDGNRAADLVAFYSNGSWYGAPSNAVKTRRARRFFRVRRPRLPTSRCAGQPAIASGPTAMM